jgi:hypothetical protein
MQHMPKALAHLSETDQKVILSMVLMEAHHWYGMTERYVYATPALPEMHARLKFLQDALGEVPSAGWAY